MLTPRIASAFVVLSLASCGGACPQQGATGPVAATTTVAAPPSTPPHSETIALPGGQTITIMHGAGKDPAVAGCADGTREGFHDDAAFPRIAGCMARWEGQLDMRAARTGHACGDAAGPCTVPGDACASGWHLCGASGAVADLRQVSGDQCAQAGGGRYSGALSHCSSQSGCQHDESPTATYSCFPSGWCSEPVCCGNDCGEFGVCRDGVWAGATHIPRGTDQGCGHTSADRAGGVLCCHD